MAPPARQKVDDGPSPPQVQSQIAFSFSILQAGHKKTDILADIGSSGIR
jgi:hypothetical protein